MRNSEKMSGHHRQPQVSVCQINERLKRTQMIRPPWRTMFHAETLHLVQTYANAIGCPEEYVCFPLLSIVSSLISSKASIEVTDSWHEPATLWFAVLARKGELKSTTVRYFEKALIELESILINREGGGAAANSDSAAQTLLIHESEFALGNLKTRLTSNGNSMVMLSDDLTMLYDHIDDGATKLERRNNQKLLDAVYQGVERNSDLSSGRVETLSLNVVGFLHPARAAEIINRDDLDSVASHLLFVHPIERDCFMDDIIPVPKYTPPLQLLFKIVVDAHRRRLSFRLNAEARELTYDYLNDLIGHKKMVAGDENKRYVLSKACGQFCRLILVIHTLNGAVKEAQTRHENAESIGASLAVVDNQWRTSIISPESVRQARDLMNFLIDQKFILMGFESPDDTTTTEQQQQHQPMNISFDMKSGQWLTSNGSNNNGIVMPTATKSIPFGHLGQSAPPIGYVVPPPAHTAFSATKAALETPLHVQRSLFKNYADNFHMLTVAAAAAQNHQQQQQQKKEQQLEPLNLNVNYDLLTSHSRQRSPTTDSQSSHSPLTMNSTKNNNHMKPGRVIGREENGCYQYDFSNLLPYGAKNIRSLLTSGYLEISASLVAGRHLMPPTRTPGTENRYKTEAAVAYLHKVAELGFGTIHRTNKRSYIFKKRNYEELNDDARRVLADIQVTEQAYRKVKLSIVDADKKNPLLAQIDLSNNNTNTSNANTSILNNLIIAPNVATCTPTTVQNFVATSSMTGSETNSPNSTELKMDGGVAASPMLVDH